MTAKQKDLQVHTFFGNEVSMLVDGVDSIMSAFTPAQRDAVEALLQVRELPKDIGHTAPEEVVKLAAILGLRLAADIASQKRRTLAAVRASN